jgi:hypothetical protein
VIRPWRASYDPALRVAAGDPLTLGRRDDEWPGWVWAVGPAGIGGWLPERLITEGPSAVADFDTRELTVAEGDLVTTGEPSAGWVWCRARDGRAGWVPERCLAAPLPPRDRGPRT